MNRSALYKQYETDSNAEKDGIWLEIGEVERDGETVVTSFLCRRAGGANMGYNKNLSKRTKNHRQAIQSGTIDLQVARKISVEVFLDSVLIGWENVPGREEGEFLEFNRDNAAKLFKDLPDLLTDLSTQAGDMNLFKVIEEESKN